jgi:hypothetical protein
MTKQGAKAFIASLLHLRTSATDEQAVNATAAYPEWKEEVEYKVDERILYNGILYRVLINHTSQSDWTPDAAVSLFAKVLIPDEDIIYEWVQPDSTNPYAKGDKVTHNSKTWISIVDGNVWEPGVYGWEEFVE